MFLDKEQNNNVFTFCYSQPEAYHFCQDSVLFAKAIAQDLLNNAVLNEETRAVDVAAGCGVIGFEVMYHLHSLRRVDFVELQPEFQHHLYANLQIVRADRANLGQNISSEVFIEDHRWFRQRVDAVEKYDLVFINPPYFDAEDSALGPDPLRNNARFLLAGDFAEIIATSIAITKQTGRIYLLIKSGVKHGKDRAREVHLTAAKLGLEMRLTTIANIRGTLAVRLERSDSPTLGN